MDNVVNIDNYLRIDIQDAIMVIISTVLIVLIAKKFFWKYAKDYLDARSAHIQGELDASAAKLQESESLKMMYEEKMANAKGEAAEVVADAKARASKEANGIVEKAKENAEAMKQKANLDIENEKAKVKERIKEEISEVAFLAASKVVGKELDESIHKKYVEDFIDEAGEESWRA